MRATLLAAVLVFLAAAPVASQDADPAAKLGIWAGRSMVVREEGFKARHSVTLPVGPTKWRDDGPPCREVHSQTNGQNVAREDLA